MMWMRTLLLAAAMSLMLGRPVVAAEETPCEDSCAGLAAANCERINSLTCTFYISGCLSGCAVGQIVSLLID